MQSFTLQVDHGFAKRVADHLKDNKLAQYIEYNENNNVVYCQSNLSEEDLIDIVGVVFVLPNKEFDETHKDYMS